MTSTHETTPTTGTTMRAAVRDTFGGPEVLRVDAVQRPQPGPDQVLVKVHAASLNPYDLHMLTGMPYIVRLQAGLRSPKSRTIGVDVAGTVVAMGDQVTGHAVGDEVFGVCPGSVADYALARPDRLVAKPAEVSFAEAAAVPLASTTAIQAMRDRGGLRTRDRVLVNGASGGIGTQAVQIAKSFGAEVTGVCSARNVDLARSTGADHVISYSTNDFTTTGPYDLIVDTLGLRKLRDIRRALTDDGRYVTVAGPKDRKWIGVLLYPLKVAVAGAVWSQTMKSMLAAFTKEDLELFARLLASGALRPVIDRTFPLERAPEAVQYLADGHARGKTIITVGEKR